MTCNVDRRQLLAVAGSAALGLGAGVPELHAAEAE